MRVNGNVGDMSSLMQILREPQNLSLAATPLPFRVNVENAQPVCH